MKKVLSVVLAVAMVLGCVASLAFVVGDMGSVTTPTNSALRVEDIHVTDEAAMVAGMEIYGNFADLDGNLYAQNQIIRIALDIAVYNPNNYSNVSGVAHTTGRGNTATLIIESDTVDFALNQQQPYASMVLYKPMYTGVTTVNNVLIATRNAKDNTPLTSIYTPKVSEDHSKLEIAVRYLTQSSGNNVTLKFASENARFDEDSGLVLIGVSDNVNTVRTDYTLVFTGVTKGATTEEGRITVSMQDKAGDSFEGDGIVTVTRNNHVYRIVKKYDNQRGLVSNSGNYGVGDEKCDAYYEEALNWADVNATGRDSYPELFDVDVVGYEVYLLLSNADGKVETEADNYWGAVGRFETEQVRYGKLYKDLWGDDVPTLGESLGFAYLDADVTWNDVIVNTLDAQRQLTFYKESREPGNEIYKVGSNPDYLKGGRIWSNTNGTITWTGVALSDQPYMTARTALEQFMSDFGFGFGSSYGYKVEDANFVEAATYEELGTATYNGNAIVIEQPDEDPDVEEPTDNDEVPDEGDIDEEPIPDEGDIDEEPIPDEPVPETGDASAAVAVALTAAALVAAAGLAVVLKKAR